MKKIRRNVSLNQRLAGISLAVFIPMILVMTYLLASLTNATSAHMHRSQKVSRMPICMQEILKNVWITVCIWLLSEKEIWKNLVTERQL